MQTGSAMTNKKNKNYEISNNNCTQKTAQKTDE